MRVDQVFSYWIILWYVLFIFKYINYNPKFALIVALLQQTLGVVYKLIYEPIIFSLILGISVICIKIIPLYTIINTTIKNRDIYFTFGLFILYNAWLYVNKTNLYDILIQIKDNKGPFFVFMSSLL